MYYQNIRSGGCGSGIADCCLDLFRSRIRDKEVLREDATFRVVQDVAGVTPSSRIVEVSRSEGSSFQCIQGITSDCFDLTSEFEGNGFINCRGIG